MIRLITPRQELPDGRVITFAQQYKNGQVVLARTVRKILGSVWDEAERNILCGLAEYDLGDVYRKRHGYTNIKEYSWYHYANGRQKGYRLDHIFASASLNPVECRYLHPFRESRLSDHSPIEAVFRPQF
jgi:exonuclease III